MFERFFGPKKVSEEEAEDQLSKLLEEIFEEDGVNTFTITRSFEEIRRLNKNWNHIFTNNRLLNILKKLAIEKISGIECVKGGGRVAVETKVINDIDNLRNGLTLEEQKT